jgi:hypothetical protein
MPAALGQNKGSSDCRPSGAIEGLELMITFLLVVLRGGQFFVPWWLYRIRRRRTENKELLRAILFQLKGQPLPEPKPDWETPILRLGAKIK